MVSAEEQALFDVTIRIHGSAEPEQVCAIKRLQDERSISAQVAVKEPEITGRSGDAASTGFSLLVE